MSEGVSPYQARYERLNAQLLAAWEAGDDAAADAVGESVTRAFEEWYTHDPPPDFVLERAAAECEKNADWSGAEEKYHELIALAGDTHYILDRRHMRLAAFYQLLNRNEEGLEHCRLATAAAAQIDMPATLTLAQHAEACCLMRCERDGDADKLARDALLLIQREESEVYDMFRAKLLLVRAACAIHQDRLADAAEILQQTSAMLQQIAELVESILPAATGTRADLAIWWTIMARLRGKQGNQDGAIDAWQQAQSLHRAIMASDVFYDTVYYKATLAGMLKGLAEALLANGQCDEAEVCRNERAEILYRAGLKFRI